MELVGMEIKKKFEGFGVFTGTVQSYDPTTGYFNIQYEDGDSEDVDSEEIQSILREMGRSPPNLDQHARKIDGGHPSKKRKQSDSNFEHLKRSAAKFENALVSQDDDMGGDENPISIKPELPPSSKDLDLDGLNAFDLFSVYTCLRSFSRLLFLSPFTIEAFVAALRCKDANFLIDSIHCCILQALRPHLALLADEGCRSASDCLRYLNWDHLDLVTWPLFLSHYLVIHCSGMKRDSRVGRLKLLESEYYIQPAGVKLEVLCILCDDVIEVAAIRSELSRRMDSETNVDASFVNLDMEKKRKSFAHVDPLVSEGPEETDDGNFDECCLCGMDGSLICCDGCPAAFHSRCVGVVKDHLPEGKWYCQECLVEKCDGLVNMSKPFCGAELLCTDPHGRLYFGTCNRLLVSDSCESDASYHYYVKDDLGDVITALRPCYAYSAIVNTISMYWGFPVDTFRSKNQFRDGVYDGSNDGVMIQVCSEPPLPSKLDVFGGGNAGRPAVVNFASSEQCGFKSSQLTDLAHLNSVIAHEPVGVRCPFSCSEPFDEKVHAAYCIHSHQTCASCPLHSPSMQVTSLEPTGVTAASENNINFPASGYITDQKKVGHSDLHFNLSNYINYYSFGQIASSISAVLMHKSSEGNNNELKKSAEDIKTAQLIAISQISTKRYCYAYQKIFSDVQNENCGWCLSCKTSSDFDCLFKVAINKKLKDSKSKDIDASKGKNLEVCKVNNAEDIESQTSVKTNNSQITSAALYILSIADRAGSLLSGPWEKPHYSQYWRKVVLKAENVASLKPLLLSLELHLRRVALFGEWSKPADDANAIVSSSVVTGPVRKSSSNFGSRKQGKRNIVGDGLGCAAVSDIYWWRGGRLSRQLFQCKMLPHALASKGGRQAGRRKIPDMLYPDGVDFAKRSKYVSWRVAVEMSQSVAQFIYHAKEFDANIKWAELSDTRLYPKLAKDSKNMTRQMKRVTICGKCKEGNQVKYLLDVGKRETVPAIVAKHGVLLEESTAGRKRYWLTEAHVPLNLLKSYEAKTMKKRTARLLKKTDSGDHHAKEAKFKTKKRKRSEWLSYLVSKEQKTEKQLCVHCNKGVSSREAVNCQLCSGIFHRKHFRAPKDVLVVAYMCNRCRGAETINQKNNNTKRMKAKNKDSKDVKERDSKNVKANEGNIENMNSADTGVICVDLDPKNVEAKEMGVKNMNSTGRGVTNVEVDSKNVKSKEVDTKDMNSTDKLVTNVEVDSKNVKSKEVDTKDMNSTDRVVTSVDVQPKGTKGVKAIKVKAIKVKAIKDLTTTVARDKGKKNIEVEDNVGSERVKQQDIRNIEVKPQRIKIVFRGRKISEDNGWNAIPKEGKHALPKSKKSRGHNKIKKSKSKSVNSETIQDGISWCKRKRSVVHCSYWLNGLLWACKSATEPQRDFRERNIILPFQNTDPDVKPLCSLCRQEYNSGVIYICCERCQDWFHGVAFCLPGQNINNLVGFRCHKCRKKSEPRCPFLENALIGDVDLDTEYKIGVNIVCDDDPNKLDASICHQDHCGSPIVCKRNHLNDTQREGDLIEHRKVKVQDHGTSYEGFSATVEIGDRLEESESKKRSRGT